MATKWTQKELLKKMPGMLKEAFDWDSSPQGWAYWDSVCSNMEAICLTADITSLPALNSRLDKLQAELNDIRKQLA